MKETLSANIRAEELRAAVMDMKLGKAPGPDGITLEFYRHYWDLISPDFVAIIHDSVEKGHLPEGIIVV